MYECIEVPSAKEILSLRQEQQAELNCQIIFDSIHRRAGWTKTYCIKTNGSPLAFASVALAGPWHWKPTLIEFYVQPQHRDRVFEYFEAFINAGKPRFMETQSNDILYTSMLHTYAQGIQSEKIIFKDQITTNFTAPNITLLPTISSQDIQKCIDSQSSGPEWHMQLDNNIIGKGGFLFHYNKPYCDLYMEINDSFRRQGLGSYLVQELKRFAYEVKSIPCARCDLDNLASRRTLQKAGFIPCGHLLTGAIKPINNN